MQLRRHFSFLAERFDGARVLDNADLLVVDSGLPTDTFNVVVDSRLGSDASTRVRRVIASFGDRPFSWWVGPQDTPTDLRALLADAGLTHAEDETAMTLDLAQWAPSTARRYPLRIARVQDPRSLEAYAEIIAANWSPPDEHVLRLLCSTGSAAFGDMNPMVLLVGYIDDQPVTAAEVCLGDDGVAGLYSVATVRQHRGNGYGSLITEAALWTAKERGMHSVVLQASADGLSIYQRLGFVADGVWSEYKPA